MDISRPLDGDGRLLPRKEEAEAADNASVNPPDELVVIYEARDEIEAKIVRAVLVDAGIPVFEPEEIFALYPFPIGTLADESVVVPSSFEQRAREELKRALERGEQAGGEGSSEEDDSPQFP